MGLSPLEFDDPQEGFHSLLCPNCRGSHVHIDDVYVAGRPREDGEIHPVHVNSHGNVDTKNAVVPLGWDGAGRRHTVSLGGWCEECGSRFAIAFKQHKGETQVSVLQQAWVAQDGSPASVAT